MTEPAFVYETTIRTTPERLWQALTSGEITRAYWFDRRIDSEWTVGAPVRFFDGDSDVVTDTGTVLECDPPRRLVYSFAQDPAVPPTRVAFDLEPRDDGVRLRLVHDELADPGDVEGWRGGWTPILTNLQALLEGDTPDAAPWVTGGSGAAPTLARRLPHPPAEVFHALTDPELVSRWWKPAGATTTVHAVDARTGGALSLTVTLPGGQVVELRGTYREVAAPHLLAHTLRAGDDPHETLVTWRAGRRRHRHAARAHRDGHRPRGQRRLGRGRRPAGAGARRGYVDPELSPRRVVTSSTSHPVLTTNQPRSHQPRDVSTAPIRKASTTDSTATPMVSAAATGCGRTSCAATTSIAAISATS